MKSVAESHPTAHPATANAEAAEANALIARVHEIHAMDKSRLSCIVKKDS
jgi:hypothetical protein